jgi:hypothetical protein
MLYEVSHYIQEHIPILWKMVEYGNSAVFAMMHNRKIKDIPELLEKYTDKFRVIEAGKADVGALVRFFSEQPDEAFKFFNPHGFDEKTLLSLVNRKSFLMFLVKDGEEIVGYFFLRCFTNGNAFKGRIVDARRRNQGIAKLMGNVINDIVLHLGLRLFTTISPDNYASLASTKAVNNVKIVRTLENGYYYIECTPKK